MTFSGPGTLQLFLTSVQSLAYASFTLSGTFTDQTYTHLSQASLDVTSFSQAPGAPSLGSFGIACGQNSSGYQYACGDGLVANLAASGLSLGVTEAWGGSVTATRSGYDAQSSGSAQAYAGSLGALSLTAAAFPTWQIAGGTTIGQVSGSLNLAFASDGLTVTSASGSLSDSADGLTISFAASSGGVVGTISQTQTGAPVATFTTDRFGDAALTFSNGSSIPIVDYVVIG